MPQCIAIDKCAFFNDKMKEQPLTSNYLKRNFCLKDNTNCARHIVSKTLGKDKVPLDLSPKDIEIAKNLIGEI